VIVTTNAVPRIFSQSSFPTFFGAVLPYLSFSRIPHQRKSFPFSSYFRCTAIYKRKSLHHRGYGSDSRQAFCQRKLSFPSVQKRSASDSEKIHYGKAAFIGTENDILGRKALRRLRKMRLFGLHHLLSQLHRPLRPLPIKKAPTLTKV